MWTGPKTVERAQGKKITNFLKSQIEIIKLRTFLLKKDCLIEF